MKHDIRRRPRDWQFGPRSFGPFRLSFFTAISHKIAQHYNNCIDEIIREQPNVGIDYIYPAWRYTRWSRLGLYSTDVDNIHGYYAPQPKPSWVLWCWLRSTKWHQFVTWMVQHLNTLRLVTFSLWYVRHIHGRIISCLCVFQRNKVNTCASQMYAE